VASTALRSRTLLATATIATLSYIAYFTGEHFADTIGWPLTLIALGLLLIGMSAFAFRLGRSYGD